MNRSDIVTIVLARTCDHDGLCEDDWMIVDAHVRRGRVVERGYVEPGTTSLTHAEWVREHLTNSWPACPMKCAFGDDVPLAVAAAERVLVRGRVVGEWSYGMECGSDYDEYFEIADYRVLEVHTLTEHRDAPVLAQQPSR